MPLRLAYASTLADDVDVAVIDDIVEYSKAANEKRGVTGMLALDETRICQILEGPKERVDALFDRIRSDTRHQGVVLLDRDEIEKPHFGDWGMVKRRMVDVVELLFSL